MPTFHKKREGKSRGEYCQLMGKAGEYAVASQLILRGIIPMWPSIDQGFDLQTVNGCRIQIKASHIDGQTNSGKTFYWFPISSKRNVAISPTKAKCIDLPKFSERSDIVVCWGIEENRFWIIPAKLCDQASALVLGYINDRRFSGSIDAMRDMAKLGYTRAEIGKKFNLLPSNVSKYINSGRTDVPETTYSKIRQHENAWENIIDFKREVVIGTDPSMVLVEEDHF